MSHVGKSKATLSFLSFLPAAVLACGLEQPLLVCMPRVGIEVPDRASVCSIVILRTCYYAHGCTKVMQLVTASHLHSAAMSYVQAGQQAKGPAHPIAHSSPFMLQRTKRDYQGLLRSGSAAEHDMQQARQPALGSSSV